MVSVFSMDLHLDIRSNMGVLKMLEGIPIYFSSFFLLKKKFLICLSNYLTLYFNSCRYLNKNKCLFSKKMPENSGNTRSSRAWQWRRWEEVDFQIWRKAPGSFKTYFFPTFLYISEIIMETNTNTFDLSGK